MTGWWVLGAVLLLFLAGCSRSVEEAAFEIPGTSEEPREVVAIVDGDTLRLDNGEVVRLIGIDAPEAAEPLYDASSYHLARMFTDGSRVELQKEDSNRDRYGRLLRHVMLGEENVAVSILAAGMARLEEGYNGTHGAAFRKAQSGAQAAKRGIWKE